MKSILNIKSTLLVATIFIAASCTKVETDDDFTKGDPPPVDGGFTNSSEVAPTNLVAHFPFEGNNNDAKNAVTGGVTAGSSSFVDGRKGKAYKGASLLGNRTKRSNGFSDSKKW